MTQRDKRIKNFLGTGQVIVWREAAEVQYGFLVFFAWGAGDLGDNMRFYCTFVRDSTFRIDPAETVIGMISHVTGTGRMTGFRYQSDY
ncbi:MAG: hypothetical protein K2J18_03260 [Paramuribaculum sp.]|nr:hypothetical protein [Paramuribaculum sp.]